MTILWDNLGAPGQPCNSFSPSELSYYSSRVRGGSTSTKTKRDISDQDKRDVLDEFLFSANCSLSQAKMAGIKLKEMVDSMNEALNNFLFRRGTPDSPAFSCLDLSIQFPGKSSGKQSAFLDLNSPRPEISDQALSIFKELISLTRTEAHSRTGSVLNVSSAAEKRPLA